MKEYRLTENIRYVIRSAHKWDKNIIFILLVAVVFHAVFPYMYPIISRQVIDCILKERGYSELICVILGCSGIFLLLKVVYSKLNLPLWWRFFYLKNKFVIQKMEKVMEMPFDALEDKSVLDRMEKAEQSVQGTNGAEGMLYSIQSSMVCVIKIVMSAAVMSILSPVIAAAALALSLINYKVVSRTKRLDGQSGWAVEDLNLSIRQGVKIAVVGKNGSGKSTLIKLLCRLYEPRNTQRTYKKERGVRQAV